MVLNFWIFGFVSKFADSAKKKCFLHTILCLSACPMQIIHRHVYQIAFSCVFGVFLCGDVEVVRNTRVFHYLQVFSHRTRRAKTGHRLA